MMTSKERFYATIERRDVDYPASWLGMPTTEAEKRLVEYLGVKDLDAARMVLRDDIYPIDVPYCHPPANHIAVAFDFAKRTGSSYEERTLTSPGFFEDFSDPSAVAAFAWPDPAEHIDPAACAAAVARAPRDRASLGIMWSAHFQDACAAFGMETAMVKMLECPELFRAVIDRITEFYLRANAIFYEATLGNLDAVLLGNDLGSQRGLTLSPDAIREFVMPGIRALIAQAKRYGLKVIYHSCGAIRDIIPDLIAAGVDAVHPIQARAAGMEPERLKKDFGDRVAFCGGVDVQDLLVNGSPEQVKAAVLRLKEIFPTGLIVSPSHEALLADVAPENIVAVFAATRG